MGIYINQVNSLQVLRLKPPSPTTKRIVWSKQDLDRLKTLLNSYLSMKEIARVMNRTPASINSVLDRNKMRLRKYTKRSEAAPTAPPKPKRRTCTDKKSFAESLTSLPAQMEFSTLVAWLALQGIDVTATAYRQVGNHKASLYYVEGVLMPAYRVLMKANELRTLKGLPLAHVKGITEF